MSLKKLVTVFLLVGLISAALAQSQTQSPQSDGVERTFEFSYTYNKVEARIRLRDGDAESELRHQLELGDFGAEFRVEFQQKAGDTQNDLRMRLRLFELIEYIPDSTPGYQNDTVVRSYNNWNWVNYINERPSSNDSRVYTMKTYDNIFGLTVRINSPTNTVVNVNPEDVKFDVELDVDAMRAAGWLNGTEVALKVALVSTLESKQDGSQDESSITVGSTAALEQGSLFFSWLNYVQCDVNKVSVVSSPMHTDDSQLTSGDESGSTANVVAFAFVDLQDASNRACVWDPVVSASRASSQPTIASSAVAQVISFVVLFVGAFITLF